MSDIDDVPSAIKPEGYWGITGPGRYMCTVLDEMRKCNETRNYAALAGLIEEVQVMGNRMENALERNKGLRAGEEYVEALKKEIAELEKVRKKIREEEGPAGKAPGC